MNLRNLSFLRERLMQRIFPKNPTLVQWWNRDRESVARIVSVTLVMCLAVGIRIWGLNQIGFNTDEAVYSGQAAAIAQFPLLKEIFPFFRAHPLLFQFLLALLFDFGVSDLAARLLAVAIGVATVFIVYRLGSLLYGEYTGILAALILAVMPYHVVVSRQVLLDGPMVLCSTLPFTYLPAIVLQGIRTCFKPLGLG